MILKFITKDGLNLMLGIGLGFVFAGLFIGPGIFSPLYFVILGPIIIFSIFPLVYLKKQAKLAKSKEVEE